MVMAVDVVDVVVDGGGRLLGMRLAGSLRLESEADSAHWSDDASEPVEVAEGSVVTLSK